MFPGIPARIPSRILPKNSLDASWCSSGNKSNCFSKDFRRSLPGGSKDIFPEISQGFFRVILLGKFLRELQLFYPEFIQIFRQ